MFHYLTTLVKFGIGRATYDAAQEIRNNKITREEGVQLVRKFDQEFPNKYFREFLEYINIDEKTIVIKKLKIKSPLDGSLENVWTEFKIPDLTKNVPVTLMVKVKILKTTTQE